MDVSPAVCAAFSNPAQPTELESRRVTVMGLGRFGGGVGVVNYLLAAGAQVTVTDAASRESLTSSLAQIDLSALERLTLGGHQPEDFLHADLIVVNPAVRRDHPLLHQAAVQGIALTSEINLFWQRNRAQIIAVTGSAGKSSTATFIHQLLNAAGIQSHLGGNLGGSLLSSLDRIRPEDWIVLELSSFQLWDLNHLCFAPQVAVVTNLFPNHLDWHGTFADYAAAKQSITRWQSSAQYFVLPVDDQQMDAWTRAANRVWFGSTRRPPAHTSGITLTASPECLCLTESAASESIQPAPFWPHWKSTLLRQNVSAALAAVVAASRLDPRILSTARDSLRLLDRVAEPPGLPHRQELVGTWQGRRFINDSKATTPQSALHAMKETVPEGGRLLLLAGGADKHLDLTEFASAIACRASAVALLGETSRTLESLIISSSRRDKLPTLQASSLAQGFTWLLERSQPGDTILLSPGCASFGEFVNYEARGEAFRQLARAWGLVRRS